MEKPKVSDRERLLKLIDGDSAEWKDARRARQLFELKSKFLSFLNPSQLEARSSFLKITIILAIVLAGIVFFIGWDLFHSPAAVDSVPAAEVKEPADEVPAEDRSPVMGTREDYLAAAGSADLFNPERIKAARPVPERNWQTDAADLKLVGVDWGDHPVALIEDIQAKKTFFVKAGDQLKGFKVNEVFRDRVVLSVGEQSIELK